jgi:hypothetical protein
MGQPSGYPSLHAVIDEKTGQSVSLGATPEEAMRLYKRQEREKQLEEALKYEGETMGHCVGGYCPDVVSGRSRIYSLRDAKGEPHVTVEVQPNMKGMSPSEFYHSREIPPSLLEKINQVEASGALDDIGSLDDFVMASPEYQTYLKTAKPPNIVQIKGKQNRAPKEEYLPYVQDFVKGGEWSDVGDFKNTGFSFHATGPNGVFDANQLKMLEGAGIKVPKYLTREEANKYADDLYRIETGKDPETGLPLKPPGEKRGGMITSLRRNRHKTESVTNRLSVA